jgi:glycosyltransferase involved in cell wall biosynthesis
MTKIIKTPGSPDSADTPGNAPRVSVLMPVYNAQDFLAEAIDCILSQTFTDWELICIDDGSTDASLTILQAYADRHARVRVITRPNTGIVGALNDGLDAAQGEYIARMDADDWCAADRLAKQIDYLDAHKECVALGTWVQRTDPFGSPAGEQYPPTEHDAIDHGLLAGDGSVLVHATLVMRADVLRKIAGWRAGTDWVEDLDLFLRLAEFGQVANLSETLYTYRRHVDSVCFRNYELMCKRLKDVLKEAYERRGIAELYDEQTVRPDLAPKQSRAEHYRNWACHAIHAGNKTLARKHALDALKIAPMSPRTWKVVYWALAA